MITLTDQTIDVAAVIASVQDPAAGGTDIFIGTTRGTGDSRKVVHLEYEAYTPMAITTMEALADEARARWTLSHVSMVHRIGVVPVGEASVVIAVSAPHRAEAFSACRFLIDALKERVPIWKKEWYDDGAEWIGAPSGDHTGP